MNLLSLLSESKIEKSVDDLRNFSEAMSGFNNIVQYEDTFDLPIDLAKKSEWVSLDNPERLKRDYSFDDKKEVMYFFNEAYKHQFAVNHHFKITIDNLDVTVETHTHGFDGITDMDLDIKKFCDDLYNEINYFKRK